MKFLIGSPFFKNVKFLIFLNLSSLTQADFCQIKEWNEFRLELSFCSDMLLLSECFILLQNSIILCRSVNEITTTELENLQL